MKVSSDRILSIDLDDKTDDEVSTDCEDSDHESEEGDISIENIIINEETIEVQTNVCFDTNVLQSDERNESECNCNANDCDITKSLVIDEQMDDSDNDSIVFIEEVVNDRHERRLSGNYKSDESLVGSDSKTTQSETTVTKKDASTDTRYIFVNKTADNIPNSKPSDPKFTENETVLCFHREIVFVSKVLRVELKDNKYKYFIHYNGLGNEWDEWLPESLLHKYNEENLKLQKVLTSKVEPKNTTTSHSHSDNEIIDRNTGLITHPSTSSAFPLLSSETITKSSLSAKIIECYHCRQNFDSKRECRQHIQNKHPSASIAMRIYRTLKPEVLNSRKRSHSFTSQPLNHKLIAETTASNSSANHCFNSESSKSCESLNSFKANNKSKTCNLSELRPKKKWKSNSVDSNKSTISASLSKVQSIDEYKISYQCKICSFTPLFLPKESIKNHMIKEHNKKDKDMKLHYKKIMVKTCHQNSI